jgi:hypothetical protein
MHDKIKSRFFPNLIHTLGMHAKIFINERLDFEIGLIDQEISRLEKLIEDLSAEINQLRHDDLALGDLAATLQKILDLYGPFLSEEFRQRLLSQIEETNNRIHSDGLKVETDLLEMADAEKDVPCFKAFKSSLESLKKKDEKVSSVLIGNLTGEAFMEISLDKDGNAKVTTIANKDGLPLARKIQWALEGDDIGALTPSDDTQSVNVKSNGKAGKAQLVGRVGKLSDDDPELFESNRIDVAGIEKPDTAVAKFEIAEA